MPSTTLIQTQKQKKPPTPPPRTRRELPANRSKQTETQTDNLVEAAPPRPPRANKPTVAEEAANKAQQEELHYTASIASDNEDQTSDDVCATPIPEQTNETDQQKPHYTVSIASPENKKRLQKQQQAPNTTGSPTATKSADDEVIVVATPVPTKKTAAPCQRFWGIALASLGSVCAAGSTVAAGILLNTFMASSSSFTAAVTSMYNAYPIVTISLAIAFVIGAALITVGAHLVCKAGKASQYSVLKPTTDKVETDKHTVDEKPTTE